MTNQEAIKRIKEHIAIHKYRESHAIHIVEALEKAISALQAQEIKHSIESSPTQKALDTISRQDAIDVLSLSKEILNRALDNIDVVGTDREKYSWGLGLIESNIEDIKELPPAQLEIVRCRNCKYCEHWYADKGRCFLWHEGGIDVFEDGFCNYAERRTNA